jgi:hypothetical protein
VGQERRPDWLRGSGRLVVAQQTSPSEDRAYSLAEDVRLFQMRIAGQDEVVEAQLGVLGDPVAQIGRPIMLLPWPPAIRLRESP